MRKTFWIIVLLIIAALVYSLYKSAELNTYMDRQNAAASLLAE